MIATLQVELTFVTTEAGGRKSPVILSGYATLAAAGRHRDLASAESVPGAVFGVRFFGGALVRPGSSARTEMTAIAHPPGLQAVADAGEFTVFEPPRAVAYGRVLGPS